jgi:putative inorganic carbon (HCO3(-)) transporter
MKAEAQLTRFFSLFSLYSYLILIALLPLVVFPPAFDQVFSVKNLLLNILTPLVFVSWLWSTFLKGERIKLSPFHILVLIFWFFLILSTFLSINLSKSILGNIGSYEGVVNQSYYLILFFLAPLVFHEAKNLEKLLKVMVLVSTLIAIYGLSQFFGYDPLPWGWYTFESRRSFATLGNPVLLGAYLSTVLPISIYFTLQRRSKREVLFYLGSSLLLTAAVLTTFSRGAWFGLFLGISFLVWQVSKREREVVGRYLLIAVVVAIALAVGFTTFLTGDIPSLSFAKRIKSLTYVGGSLQTRLEIWKSGLEMIAARPLLGSGLETFRLAFPKYETLTYAKLQPTVLADNAHNFLIQLASTTGLITLLIFLSLIIYVFYQVKFILPQLERQNCLLILGITSGIIAYLAQSLFSVSAVGVTPFFWVLLGLLHTKILPNLTGWEIRIPNLGQLSWTVLALLLVALASFSIIRAVNLFTADILFAKAESSAQHGFFQEAASLYKRAIKLSPSNNYYQRFHALFYFNWSMVEKRKELWQKSLELYQKTLKLQPQEIDNYTLLAGALLYGAREYDEKFYPEAARILRKATRVRPYSASIHRLLGLYYLEKAKLSSAYAELWQAVQINPKDAKVHFYFGRYYQMIGENKKALRAYKKALELVPNFKEAREAYKKLRSEEKL